MKKLAQLILRTVNLLEAEGRVAKRQALEVVAIALIWAFSAAVLFVGFVILAAALMLALDLVVPRSLAVGMVGLLALGAGYACFAMGRNMVEKHKHGT